VIVIVTGGPTEQTGRSPGVVHDVLHDLVQDLLEEGGAHPDVLDGLGGEGLRGGGGGGALPPQGLLAQALGPPARERRGGHPFNCVRLHVRLARVRVDVSICTFIWGGRDTHTSNAQ